MIFIHFLTDTNNFFSFMWWALAACAPVTIIMIILKTVMTEVWRDWRYGGYVEIIPLRFPVIDNHTGKRRIK